MKRAVEFIGNFEDAVVRKAKSKKVDGVVCGHIHTPDMRYIEGIHYCNDGDWVETCSALVEHEDGRLELLDWTQFDTNEFLNTESEKIDDRDGRLASAG